MKHAVFDIEIAKTIDQVGGWDRTDKMEMSVGVIYEHDTDRYTVYDNAEKLLEDIAKADRISGWNIWDFDFPVLLGMSKMNWARARASDEFADLREKMDDGLRRMWMGADLDPDAFRPRTHGGFSLNDIVDKNGIRGGAKIGHGADAPIWWQQGRHVDVINYCIDDVRLERDVMMHADQRMILINRDGLHIPMQPWEPGICFKKKQGQQEDLF